MKLSHFLVVILAAACLVGFTSVEPPAKHGEDHADEVTLAPGAAERSGIVIETAQLRQLHDLLIVPARVTYNPEAMAHVGVPIRGRAVQVNAHLGANVKIGDELFTIESLELGEAQSDLLLKQASARSTIPAVELAKSAWDRALNLYDQTQGVSLAEVQKRQGEYKAAQAAQLAAEASARAASARLVLFGMTRPQIDALAASGEIDPRLTIRARIPGQIIERHLTLGELVRPDTDEIITIADPSSLWILAEVPESRAGELSLGAKARVRVGGVSIPAAVTFIAPHIETATRTMQVRLQTDASADATALKPGSFATAEIEAVATGVGSPQQVLAVPLEAIQTVEGGAAVFVPVEGEANTFAKRAVTIGRPVGGFVPVLAGLAAGEQFVTSGSFILKADLGKGSSGHEH